MTPLDLLVYLGRVAQDSTGTNIPPDAWALLLGPYGLTAGAIILVVILLREIRTQYEERLADAKQAAADALQVAKDANAGYQAALAALESRNQLERELLRPAEGPERSSRREVRRVEGTGRTT